MSRPQLEHAIRAASSSTTVMANSRSDSSAVTTILLREEPHDVHGIEDQSHRPDSVANRDGPGTPVATASNHFCHEVNDYKRTGAHSPQTGTYCSPQVLCRPPIKHPGRLVHIQVSTDFDHH